MSLPEHCEKAVRGSLGHFFKTVDSEQAYVASVGDDNYALTVIGIKSGAAVVHYRVAVGKQLFFGPISSFSSAVVYLFAVRACLSVVETVYTHMCCTCR